MVLAVQELRRNEEHRAAAASYSVLPRQNNVPFFFFDATHPSRFFYSAAPCTLRLVSAYREAAQ